MTIIGIYPDEVLNLLHCRNKKYLFTGSFRKLTERTLIEKRFNTAGRAAQPRSLQFVTQSDLHR